MKTLRLSSNLFTCASTIILFSLHFSVTDGSIEPLKAKLAELEQAVADQLDSIAAVKHSIIENDEKITKMLSSVTRT